MAVEQRDGDGGHRVSTGMRLVPAPGSYGVPVVVGLVGALPRGQRLVYTVDGTVPTVESWRLPEVGILLTDPTMVRVGVVDGSGAVVRQFSGTYTISCALATARPVATPGAGSYGAPATIALATPTPKAQIRYTTDGSEPKIGSLLYRNPLVLTASTTLRARAFGGVVTVRVGCFTLTLPALLPSGVMTATYELQDQVATPAITPASGVFNTVFVARATTSTSAGELRYRMDGVDPTETDPLIPASGIPVSVSGTVTVRGFRTGLKPSTVSRVTYTLQAEAVTASLPEAAYVGDQFVTISSPTLEATIRYTLDGSLPSEVSSIATEPIALPGSCRLTAIAMVPGWSSSEPMMWTYVLRVPAPKIVPLGGTYTVAPMVQVTEVSPLASTVYTIDGSVPTVTSAVFPAGGLQLASSRQVTVVATRAGWQASIPVVESYVLQLPTLVLAPEPALRGAAITVQVSGHPPGSEVRYSLDGSVPGDDAPIFPLSGLLVAQQTNLTVRATLVGWQASPTVSGVYTFQSAAPTLSLPAGSYVGERAVTLTSDTPGVSIHYTLDGSMPTTNSSKASTAVDLPRSCTLSAAAFATGWIPSPVVKAEYVMQVSSPVLPSPEGPLAAPYLVDIEVPQWSEVHVTTDGSAPTNASPVYAPFLVLDRTCTVRAIAIREGWQASAVVSHVYDLVATGTVIDRVNLMERPSAFNSEAWLQDIAYQTEFLTTVDPSRVWMAGTIAGADEPIRLITPNYLRAPLAGSVAIIVKSKPGWPLTAVAMGGGVFVQSGLSSCTIMALAEETRFVLSPRRAGRQAVLISSPANQGMARASVEGIK